jgi:plasmid maintenance system antidote protein VapI
MFKLQELQDQEGKKTGKMAEEIGINKVNYLNIRNNLADISLSTAYKIYKMQKKYGMTDKEFIKLFIEEGNNLEERKNTRK